MPRKIIPHSHLTATFPTAAAAATTVDAVRRFLHDAAAHDPLEAPGRLLTDYFRDRGRSVLGKLLETANGLAGFCETVVMVGSPDDLARAETFVAASAHPFYNLLSAGDRGGRPRIFFVEPSHDNDLTQGALDLVRHTSDALDPHDRWALAIVLPHGDDRTASIDDVARQAAPFRAALRAATAGDDDLRRRTLVLSDLAASPIDGPYMSLPALHSPTSLAGAGFFAAGAVGSDVVALLKGAVWFWEAAKRDPTPANRLALLAELLGRDDARVVVWHHALLGPARRSGRPAAAAFRDAERRRLAADPVGPRLHLTCDALRRDRLDASPSWSDIYAQFRAAEAAAGIEAAEIRLTRLNDTALGELCAWLDAVKLLWETPRGRGG